MSVLQKHQLGEVSVHGSNKNIFFSAHV